MEIRFITTVNEANMATFGTVVVNGYGEAFQKNEDGSWYGAYRNTGPTNIESLFAGDVARPVIWEPGDFGFGYRYF